MSKKLVIAISAALLSTRMVGAVPDPDTADAIEQIENLVEAQDLRGICEIATLNGCLTTGEGPLAVALRETLSANRLTGDQFGADVAALHGWTKKGWERGREYRPWSERPGKGRKKKRPGHPHTY